MKRTGRTKISALGRGKACWLCMMCPRYILIGSLRQNTQNDPRSHPDVAHGVFNMLFCIRPTSLAELLAQAAHARFHAGPTHCPVNTATAEAYARRVRHW